MPLVGETYRTERATLVQGDCLDVLRCLDDGEADALVTDPPSGTGFMNKSWDSFKSRDAFVDFLTPRLAECRRVCRPGAVGLVWALPRTSHWTALAIEEAGWYIEDVVCHLFGCLSDDTEILTDGGWEPYHKIEKGSIALTYNIGDDTFCWEPIQEVFTYDYCDTAYRIYSDHTDQLVSRNHRCIVEQGGAYTFAYAETLAREQEICVPILEDVRGLLEALPVRKLLAGETQQNVLAGVLRQNCVREEGRCSSGQDGEVCCSCMPTMWQREGSTCKASGNEQEHLLQPFLQSQSVRKPSIAILHQYEGENSQGQKVWLEESSVEGGSNVLKDTRELWSNKICSLSGRFSADGEEGWLCDGASVVGGQGFGTATTKGGSSSPRRPQSQEQCNLQSDAVCLQSGPQTVRASRFTRADLARVEPVHYRGIVWCVRVPSGAFVARRNGKVFVTGNSGFPKHRSKLKPGHEQWVLCRNPGPLWLGVDECRIGTESISAHGGGVNHNGRKYGGGTGIPAIEKGSNPHVGRWPANAVFSHHPECVCQGTKKVKSGNGVRGSDSGNQMYGGGKGLDGPSTGQIVGYADADGTEMVENWTCHPDCPIRLLDEQTGRLHAPGTNRNGKSSLFGLGHGEDVQKPGYTDAGGASRFFANFPAEENTSRMLYCSKASKKDRGEGNLHPTVKSTSLMSWLVKLACPEGGLVLDPFSGSGSTGVACLRTGRRFLGVESDRESCLMATRRLQRERSRDVD
jgi:hypothetical protein